MASPSEARTGAGAPAHPGACKPATHWCHPFPFGRPSAEPARQPVKFEPLLPHHDPAQATLAALRQLLAEDLDRGFWRVAIRHYLMLQACGADVPDRLRQRCEAHMGRCSRHELARIAARVRAWAGMMAPPLQRR